MIIILRRNLMNIRILQLIEGAREARGIAVIIDVFRAFSVEAYLMAGGAERIYPVGSVESAFALRERFPEAVLIGERKGIKLEGFDHGNSPTEVSALDFTGKIVAHTTSAGTQGIVNAVGADEILTGSLVNAAAIAEYIRRRNPEEVSLVCMGLGAQKPIEEDTLCAEYIKSLLEGDPMDLTAGIENLKVTSGAKFFDPARQSVFPEQDFHLSTAVSRFPFVLKLEKDPEISEEDIPGYIRKIEI